MHAIREAKRRGARRDRACIRAAADDEQMRVLDPGCGKDVDQLRRRLTSNETTDGDQDECVLGESKLGATSRFGVRRTLDPERNEARRSCDPVDRAYVTHRVLGLTDDGVGAAEQPAYGRAHRRMSMR